MTPGPLRVLHVLEATLGGTRRYLDDLAVATSELPLEHGLVYGTSRSDSAFGELLARITQARWFLTPAADLRRAVDPVRDARSIAIVRGAIRAFAPTIVHAHSAKGGAVARLAALTFGRGAPPVVYSPHALPSRLGRGYMLAERALAPLTRRFIAVSDSERTEIVAEGVGTAERVDVVYPRIDAAYFEPRDRAQARSALDWSQAPTVIGIGRLAPQKHPLGFVETIARVRAVLPDVIGIWVGDGELRADFETAARRAGVAQNVRIAGWVADVRPYIAACDVVLSTSQYESFGYVIPETLAMQRPVIAARVTGIVDVLGEFGDAMLFGADRIDEAAQKLTAILQDPALGRMLADTGRRRVIERFSTSVMGTALLASYERASRPNAA